MRQLVVACIASASVSASLFTACFSPPPLDTADSTDTTASTTSAETTSPTATSAPATTETTATTDAETSLPPTTSSTGAPDTDTDTTTGPALTTSGETTTASETTSETTGTGSLCGNGLVERGELCDDGNNIDSDECPATCMPAACGDGFLQAGVETCDDGNLDNTDNCVDGCVDAFCGDGFNHATDEQCDDGNATNGDGCDNQCHFEPACGDSVIDAPETCDDGNQIDGDGCSNACERDAAFVFVTNDKFTGAEMMDSLNYAKNRCNSEAVNLEAAMDGAQGLKMFLPWMSDNAASPAVDFVKSNIPYVLPTGTIVANNWADLIDGTLDNPINITSTLVSLGLAGSDCDPEAITWTGTGLMGQSLASTCNNWAATNTVAVMGDARDPNTDWTTCTGDYGCINQARVYCFEQL